MKRILMVLSGLCLAGSVLAADEGATPAQLRDRASIRVQLAGEYYRLQNYQEATRSAQAALSHDPKYAPAYNMLALISMELRDDDQARIHFKRALDIAPEDSDVLHNYGWFLCERGEPRLGLQQFMLAVKNPLYSGADKTLVWAGKCAQKNADPIAARSHFERALKYRPDNIEAKLNLSALQLQAGALPEARRAMLELMKVVNPPTAEVLWLGVKVERKFANREGELRYADQLRRLYPESLEASRLMAGQYE